MIKVLAHQNLLDIALQEYGDVKACFELAKLNGISVTDDLMPRTVIITNFELKITNSDILTYYKRKSIQPATASPMLILDNSNYFFGLPYMLS